MHTLHRDSLNCTNTQLNTFNNTRSGWRNHKFYDRPDASL